MDLKKIVNIMPDDKFLDYYIEMSEKFLPRLSTYLVLTKFDNINYIKSKNTNIYILKKGKVDLRNFINSFSEDTILIFHSFNLSEKDFILSIPKSIKKLWIFWGFEGYAALPKSRFLGWKSNWAIYPNSFQGLSHFLLSRIKGYFATKNNILSRKIIGEMDFCATWASQDFELANRINPSIKYIYFCYYTQELMNFPLLDRGNLNFNKLLLGNSGAPTNNHIEALIYLEKCAYPGEIYCPLSYGGGQQYIKNVLKLGKKLFGNRFKPITEFLPLNEYQKLISECGIVWMNNKRQQAAGNLFAAFYAGKVIITNPVNPLNKTFKDWNLLFFTKDVLNNLKSTNDFSLQNNRKILRSHLTIDKNKHFFNIVKVLGNSKETSPRMVN